MKKILLISILGALILIQGLTVHSQTEFECLVKGNELLDKNRPGEALEYLKRAVQLNPKSLENQNLLGFCYYKLNEYETAVYYLENVARSSPGEGWYYYIGMSYLKLEKLKDARRAFQQGIPYEEKPERKKEMEQNISRIDSYLEVFGYALQHLEEGKYDMAKKEFRHAMTYLKTKEVERKITQIDKMLFEKSRAFLRLVFIISIASAGGVIVLIFLLLARKRAVLIATLPGKIRGAIESRDFTGANTLLLRYRSLGGRLTEISPQELLAIYHGINALDKLSQEQFPDEYLCQFVKGLVQLERYEDAYEMYRRYRAAGGVPEKFSSEEFFKLHLGANALDEMLKEKIPHSWLLSYAEKFVQEKSYENAFRMLKQGAILDEPQVYRAQQASQDSAVFRIFNIYEISGRLEEFLKKLLEEPEKFSAFYSPLAQALLEKEKYNDAARVLNKKLAFYLSFEKEIPEQDFELLFSIYQKQDRVDEIDPTKVPEKYRERILDAMVKKEKNREALELLMHTPRDRWSDKDYDLCLRLYIKLDMPDSVIELFRQFKEIREVKEAPDLYYNFAIFFENKHMKENALRIYEAFMKEKIDYKDVPARYTALTKPAPERVKPAPVVETVPAVEPVQVSVMSADTMSEDSARLNKITSGKIKILKEIGRGFTGVVYEGKDIEHNRRVAVKRMRSEIAVNKKDFEKFISEARIVAKFSHPSIVEIYDIIIDGQFFYFILEFVEGYSLEKIIQHRGQLSLAETLKILEFVSSALLYSHLHNIVHGDLKPSNVLIPGLPPASIAREKIGLDIENLKVMDFSTSRIAKDILIMATGEITGTPAYMAPEQHLGFYDKRSDIFSLGVMLYEMLASRLPFEGPDFLPQKEKMIYKPIRQLIPNLPPKAEEIIKVCLQAEANKRYSSIEDFMEEIRKI